MCMFVTFYDLWFQSEIHLDVHVQCTMCGMFLAWIKLISNMFPSHVICLQVGFTACVICILYRQAYTLGLHKLLPCTPFPNVLATQLPGDHLRFRA
jgi:hypothetical protein